MSMGTSRKEDKSFMRMLTAAAPLPVPTWALLVVFWATLPVGAQELWILFGIFATLVGIGATYLLISEENRVRKTVKTAADEHVASTLDSRNSHISLSDRIRRSSEQTDEWGSLNPRQLRWIEHVYQSAMRTEVERRTENKRIKNDHYGSFATIDRIGDSEARAVREVKSFLKGLDELRAQDRVEITDPNKRELHEFDQQMNRALSA